MTRYRKFFVALATALATLSTLLPGGLDPQKIIAVVLVFAGALGVGAVSNTPAPAAAVIPPESPKP